MSWQIRRTKWRFKIVPVLLALLLQLALPPIQLLHLGHESSAPLSFQPVQAASFSSDCPAILDAGGAASPEQHHDPATCDFCRSLARLGSPDLQPFDGIPGFTQTCCPTFSFLFSLPFTSLSWAPFAPRGPPSFEPG